MCNVMVSYLKRNYKVHWNERQIRSDRADPIRLEKAYQIMNGSIIVEQIRYGEIRSEHKELR